MTPQQNTAVLYNVQSKRDQFAYFVRRPVASRSTVITLGNTQSSRDFRSAKACVHIISDFPLWRRKTKCENKDGLF